jgi:hypothetical protein
VDVTDTALQAAQLLGAEGRSAEVRGARLAALQTALVKASAEEGFRRTLVFHHQIAKRTVVSASPACPPRREHTAGTGLHHTTTHHQTATHPTT